VGLIALPCCDGNDDASPAATPSVNEHGVDPTIWTELEWLPADVDEVSRMAKPMPIVEWLRSIKLDADEHCKATLEPLTHYYMVGRPSEDPEASPTLMFFGGPPIDEAEQCADAFKDRLGFTVAREGQGITLTQAPPPGVEVEGGPGVLELRWVEKAGATVVLADDPTRVAALLGGTGTLADPAAERLRGLLSKVPTGSDAAPWMVGSTDVSAFWLQEPGLGYVASLLQTPDRMVSMGELVFSDRASAERAEANAESLYGDAKFLEPTFSGYVELPPAPAMSLRFRAEVPLEIADLSKLQDGIEKVRQVRATLPPGAKLADAAKLGSAPPEPATPEPATPEPATPEPATPEPTP
jgi:hypothetical protein